MATSSFDDVSVIPEYLSQLRRAVFENQHRPMEIRLENLRRLKASCLKHQDELFAAIE
jgi:hypothetical protein